MVNNNQNSRSDDRALPRYSVARYPFTSLVATNKQTINSSNKNHINGDLKTIRYTCPSLTTDTTIDIAIMDSDNVAIYTKTGLAHNGTFYYTLTADERVWIEAEDVYIKFTWSTSQTIAVDALKCSLFLKWG